jgi:hypothetical protein
VSPTGRRSVMKLFGKKDPEIKRVEEDEAKAIVELERRLKNVEELMVRLHPDHANLIVNYMRK